jgi:iron(III) transport system ATP-binding protein
VADFIGTMNHVNGQAVTADSVSLGSLTLACRRHEIPPGKPAVLAIRPEDILPVDDVSAAGNETDNSFNVTVREMEFLGSFWRIHLVDKQLGDSQLIADLSINAALRMDTTVGRKMAVKLPPDRLYVFNPATGR